MAQTRITNKLLKELVSGYLCKLQIANHDVLDFWWTIVPEHVARQTRPLRFVQGVLVIKVFNSCLYSLLTQYEKCHLLKKLQQRFGSECIHQLRFVIG